MASGFLVVHKPAGVTSHDVVAAVRAVTGIPKVGHTGTLDPFATGVLPLALGRSTRLIQFLDEAIKVYDATIRLGTATDTGDPTGKVIRELPVPAFTTEQVEEVLAGFVGERMQEPPAYSAVKVKGKPMYRYARKGETVKAPARKIHIHDMELLEHDEQTLRVRITCSRGTYARVLADDVARELGTTGHLEALCRDRSGPFWLDDAIDLPTLSDMVAAEEGHSWKAVLMGKKGDPKIPWRPRADVAKGLEPWLRSELKSLENYPLADVDARFAQRVRRGASVPPAPPGTAKGDRYLVVCGEDLVAVAANEVRGPKILRVP